MEDEKTSRFLLMAVVLTLAFILIAVVVVMLAGLFDTKVDNDKIFAIIGPAFSMIVGSFVGLIGGYMKGRYDERSKPP